MSTSPRIAWLCLAILLAPAIHSPGVVQGQATSDTNKDTAASDPSEKAVGVAIDPKSEFSDWTEQLYPEYLKQTHFLFPDYQWINRSEER
ncbi:MAG: hypothetical protein VB878_15450, partial [Pirellulaceae bacterium]